MVKNDISEINDIKTNTITLIVFNIILYTLIAIVLFLFGIVYVSADTIIGNNYYFQGFNGNDSMITDGVGTSIGFNSQMNIHKVLFLPINNGDIPIKSSEYYINITFLIKYNVAVYPSNTGIPLSSYQIRVGGNTVATCDGQEFMQNSYYGTDGSNVVVKYDYSCTKLIVNQNFNQTLFQASNNYLNDLKILAVQVIDYHFLDQNDLSIDSQYVGDTITDSSTRIIENNNTNTDRIIEKQTEIYNQVHGLDTLFKDDNISNHTGVFGNITFNSTGAVSGIVSAPLSAIQGIISSSCSPLVLPLPYVNKNLTLPCMSTIYTQYFGNFFTMYQAIVLGITAYWVCINIFRIVKKLGDPEDDRIEVLDL